MSGIDGLSTTPSSIDSLVSLKEIFTNIVHQGAPAAMEQGVKLALSQRELEEAALRGARAGGARGLPPLKK